MHGWGTGNGSIAKPYVGPFAPHPCNNSPKPGHGEDKTTGTKTEEYVKENTNGYDIKEKEVDCVEEQRMKEDNFETVHNKLEDNNDDLIDKEDNTQCNPIKNQMEKEDKENKPLKNKTKTNPKQGNEHEKIENSDDKPIRLDVTTPLKKIRGTEDNEKIETSDDKIIKPDVTTPLKKIRGAEENEMKKTKPRSNYKPITIKQVLDLGNKMKKPKIIRTGTSEDTNTKPQLEHSPTVKTTKKTQTQIGRNLKTPSAAEKIVRLIVDKNTKCSQTLVKQYPGEQLDIRKFTEQTKSKPRDSDQTPRSDK